MTPTYLKLHHTILLQKNGFINLLLRTGLNIFIWYNKNIVDWVGRKTTRQED